MTPTDKTLSKFLSLVLRHQPETIGLRLDQQGWADVSELLERCAAHGTPINAAKLEQLVAENDKKRFAFSDDGRKIRASQGHSLAVDLQLAEVQPPELLYHGTAERNLDSIRAQGLVKGQRQHVHLSGDPATARAVGARYGKPVVLTIRAAAMQQEGHHFFRSGNGVWLTEAVPAAFILFEEAPRNV